MFYIQIKGLMITYIYSCVNISSVLSPPPPDQLTVLYGSAAALFPHPPPPPLVAWVGFVYYWMVARRSCIKVSQHYLWVGGIS